MTKAMLLFLVTSVALGLTSLHLVRELRAERANAESLRARVTELEQVQASQPAPAPVTPFATWSVERTAPPPAAPTQTPRNGRDEQTLAALQAYGRSMPAPDAPAQEELMRQMQESRERQLALMQDPEYRDALRVQHRNMFLRSNPDLAQELGLTGEQANRFFSLIAEQAVRTTEASQAMPFDPNADREAVNAAHRKLLDIQRANEAEIAQLLGPQKFKAWQEYQSTSHVRHQANDIAQLLASNGVPLQPDLAKPLRKVLAQEQKRMLQEAQAQAQTQMQASKGLDPTTNMIAFHSENEDKHLERAEESNRRIREALSTVLTAEQVEIYAKEQDANLRVQQAQWRAMKSQWRAPANAAFQGQSFPPMMVGETVMYASPAIAVAPPAPDEN